MISRKLKIIKEFQSEYRFLSNFYPAKVQYKGLIYLSSEAAFQAAKTTDENIKKEFTNLSASESKKRGKTLILKPNWEYEKRRIMYEIVKAKFLQNEDLKIKLLDTNNCELEEGNYWNDTYWGVCNGQGANVLGYILMRVRNELKEQK